MIIKAFQSALCTASLGACLLVPFALQAGQQTPPDNTAVNKQAAPTADQGKNNLTDRELMRNIRKDVVNDKSLSTYGHNVKIIAQHGKVTLKGPVHSEDEKKSIEDHAHKYAGDGNVDNQITIKGDNK
jgi:hyperosmotically inducible protein